jgi:hypothetical protein
LWAHHENFLGVFGVHIWVLGGNATRSTFGSDLVFCGLPVSLNFRQFELLQSNLSFPLSFQSESNFNEPTNKSSAETSQKSTSNEPKNIS